MSVDRSEGASLRGRARAQRQPRSGRPPKELAGEVEARILDAAANVFQHRGFEGASIDEIAEVARAGKPTIYARFPNKRALFTAMVMRVVSQIEHFATSMPTGTSIEERLAGLAGAFVRAALAADRVAIVRLAIAEARQFPDLAATVGRLARERGGENFAGVLGELARSDEIGALPAFAPERLAMTARLFLDLALLPLILRALFGEPLELLHADIGPHVAHSVTFFLAACRHGAT